MKEISTTAIDLSFSEGMLTATIREQAVLDQKDISEFLTAARSLVGDQRFVLLMDGRNPHFMVQAAQEQLKKHPNPKLIANAILTKDTLTERRVQVFINTQHNYTPIRQFKNRDTAVSWLRAYAARPQNQPGIIPVMIVPEVKWTEHFDVRTSDVHVEVSGLMPGIRDLELIYASGDSHVRQNLPVSETTSRIVLKQASRFWFEYSGSDRDYLLGLKISA